MSEIATTLMIYVPAGQSGKAKHARSEFRAALEGFYVGNKDDYSATKWAELKKAYYTLTPGIERIVNHGGTIWFRDHTKYGQHEFKDHIPACIDWTQHNDAGTGDEGEAQLEHHRAGQKWTVPSDNGATAYVEVGLVEGILRESRNESELREALMKIVAEADPKPTYEVGTESYTEEW